MRSPALNPNAFAWCPLCGAMISANIAVEDQTCPTLDKALYELAAAGGAR